MRQALLVGIVVIASSWLILAAPASGQAPTWTNEVGPLLAQKCMNCHRPSQVAPMSLLRYEDARRWAQSIRTVVQERIMPPWHADPRYGHFGNDRSLTDEQIRTIVSWVDAGAPRGAGEFTPPEYAEGWLFAGVAGPPDYVFEFPEPFTVPATGPDVYVDLELPIHLTEDIWVQAVEVRGNSRVVHHSSVYVVRPDGTRDPTGRLAAYTPGKQWDRFPAGSGKLIRAGSKLLFSMHYNTTGLEEEDRHRVGIWLARQPLQFQIYSTVAADVSLKIPPHEPNYESRGQFVFPRDAEITLMKPHMHWRGKDMLYRVVYPDNRVDTLLSVPKYDMGWQISYELAEPVPVPKGARMEVISHFDNSSDNPWNPDPSLMVIWGQDSRDEMMEGWFDYRVKMDEPVVPRAPQRTTSYTGSRAEPTGAEGIWNLETGLLAERPTRGSKHALLRVRPAGGRLQAEMTSIRNTFLPVRDFQYENGEMRFSFGAYQYALKLDGGKAAGTVTSPAGTQEVSGTRQEALMFAGKSPQPFHMTRPGVIGHRTSFGPPRDEADPEGWVKSRIESPGDFAFVPRAGIAIAFTNPEEFADELRAHAGHTVNLTGTWVGEKIRIEKIEMEKPAHRH